jgi:hypothetical protein
MKSAKFLNPTLILIMLIFQLIVTYQYTHACNPNEDNCDCYEAGTWAWDKELAIGKFTTTVSCSCAECIPQDGQVHWQCIKAYVYPSQPETLVGPPTGDICNI